MSNICMDTVVFYAKSQKEKVGLATLKLAFEKAYPSESAVDNKFSRFFVEINKDVKSAVNPDRESMKIFL